MEVPEKALNAPCQNLGQPSSSSSLQGISQQRASPASIGGNPRRKKQRVNNFPKVTQWIYDRAGARPRFPHSEFSLLSTYNPHHISSSDAGSSPRSAVAGAANKTASRFPDKSSEVSSVNGNNMDFRRRDFRQGPIKSPLQSPVFLAQGFSTPTLQHLGQTILGWGTVLCTVGCFAASLASTH